MTGTVRTMVAENGGEGGRTAKDTSEVEEMERLTDDVEDGEIVGEAEEGEVEDVNAVGDGAPPEKQRLSHPLEHSWTLWFDNPFGKSKQVAWGSSMRPIYTFSTVEEFWGLYNNIRRPSNLAVGADVHCFKNGIEPKWEDPVCANGGKWTISCSRGKVDTWWLYTLLAMIGEQFDHGDEICGAVVNVRTKQEKISIWTKNGSKQAAQTSIGKQWKNALDLNETIGFILHDDAKKHDRHAKSSFQV